MQIEGNVRLGNNSLNNYGIIIACIFQIWSMLVGSEEFAAGF